MEGEIKNFIKVWVSIFLSVCYCFAVAKTIPKGTTRFISIFPVVCLFLFLPFNLYSIHLGGPTVLFIAWLANFKLLLFAFGKGPLSDPSLSLSCFVALVCLPIRIQKNSLSKGPQNEGHPKKPLNGRKKENPFLKTSKSGLKLPLIYAAKALLMPFLMFLNNYRELLHPKVLMFFNFMYLYIGLDVLLSVLAALVQTLLGLQLASQFNEPYFSTSLQDFWGYRWNLAATDVLRLTVYNPVFCRCIPILGQKWAFVPAILGTFLVSGLAHELLLYFHCRVWPTWGAMYFFLFHGLLLIVEIVLKKTFSCNWQLPQLISGLLIFGFAIITLMLLIMAPLTKSRVDLRAVDEYAAVGRFLKDGFSSSSYAYKVF